MPRSPDEVQGEAIVSLLQLIAAFPERVARQYVDSMERIQPFVYNRSDIVQLQLINSGFIDLFLSGEQKKREKKKKKKQEQEVFVFHVLQFESACEKIPTLHLRVLIDIEYGPRSCLHSLHLHTRISLQPLFFSFYVLISSSPSLDTTRDAACQFVAFVLLAAPSSQRTFYVNSLISIIKAPFGSFIFSFIVSFFGKEFENIFFARKKELPIFEM